MKKVFALALVIGFFWALPLFADGRCPLTENGYFLDIEDTRYELSGFDCTFGPGCQADCDLWYGIFETGPLYHMILPFSCSQDDTAIIAGCPCSLNLDGDLECLAVDTSSYYCVELGNKTWCFPEEPEMLLFLEVE